jgi:ankyrin repeat protein
MNTRRNRRHRRKTQKKTQYGGNIRELVDAASRGDLDRVKSLVEKKGIDINQPGTYKDRTALMMAAKKGHIHVVKYLVDHGADVQLADEEGETPLLMAIMSPHEQHRSAIITYLLEHGADVNHADDSGRTPLHLVSFDGTVDQAQMLMDRGADVNRRDIWGKTPLQNAVDAHSIDMIRYLVEHGADVRTIDKEGNTVLHCTDYPLDDTTFEYFIEHGADVHAVNRAGQTVLFSVVRSCVPDNRLSLLVERGVDIRSEPVLVVAIQHCTDPMVELVLERGADVHQTDASGNTPLHATIRHTRTSVVDLLLEHGAAADVNRTNALGNTPLHDAVVITESKEKRNIVQRLIEHGADVNRRNIEGKSPLYLAFQQQYLDPAVIQMLLEGGANVRQTNPGGETFLHLAAKHKYPNLHVIQSLIQHGADVFAKDAHGKTAKEYVIQKATGTHKYLEKVANRLNAENVIALMSMHGKPDKASTKIYSQGPGVMRNITKYFGGGGRRTWKKR